MKWLLICLLFIPVRAADMKFERSSSLQKLVEGSMAAATETFAEKKLRPDQIAVTLVDLRDSEQLRIASHRGSEPIYPASVIKLFYLEAAHRWMNEGKLADTPELRRAMKDMIVESYNEATHYIVDLLTGTTSGPELAPAAMAEWAYQRNAVNRYFLARGFSSININQKPWGEGPYGRERIFVGESYTNRNMLTTDATARLLTEISLGEAVSKVRSQEMMVLLRRDVPPKTASPDDPSRGFLASALPSEGRLWSKAGWTSKTRHDAAYVELPNGAKFVLVIFTVDHAQELEIIPAIAGIISSQMGDSQK